MSLQHQFDESLQRILAGVANQCGMPVHALRVAVAYSGGKDSSALLALLAHSQVVASDMLVALHVHHGLSAQADHWESHCQTRCAMLGLRFAATRIRIGSTAGQGLESTARALRYAALGRLCRAHGADVLLTAHHQDDQAETILMQLLRGAGIAGLCGMQDCHRAPELLAHPTLFLARPMLDIRHDAIEQLLASAGISHIEDESNADPRYLRNALRRDVMPLLAQYFPGYQSRLGRSSRHAQAALGQIAGQTASDYQACVVDPASQRLSVAALASIPSNRIDQVLRHWISIHGCKMPTTARLAEMRKQLLTAAHDARVAVHHDGAILHRYREHLSMEKATTCPALPTEFVWRGEPAVTFPEFAGRLVFAQVAAHEPGIPALRLLERTLTLRLRQGGEKLKLAANRPTRDMKHHYQSLGVPYWQRETLPFVWCDSALVFAAGVGMDAGFLSDGTERIALHWEFAHEEGSQ